ncbi:MAG: AraC family transcriptional regulator [Candidatus Pedobacter colombiensis]|uniref:AraC family transcriptional regulator n=1 Tax=Candidatus Pedobacter colombiensis TaxID=3121371 RepID=A0AAJ6BA89_9SPHI|nr:AraC family transcriptional regulator [Pedobacter sp.]WEK21018.1 MAG: AraC family transcriptional regulator [Pedobacter sp.]
MINTIESLPAPALRDYIKCYGLREVDTEGQQLHLAIHAIEQSLMPFWLSSTPLQHITEAGIRTIDIKKRWLLGLTSSFQGYQVYNGRYRFFNVQFKNNGFYSIFKIPMPYISDQLLIGDDVIGKDLQFLQEQLEESTNMEEMKSAADSYFLKALFKKKQGYNNDRITTTTNMIAQYNYQIDIKTLARQVNMSLRGLERHFYEQVGTTPKQYSKIVRFNKSLLLKTLHPEKKWTDIANQYGYFDQNHLIKDFKVLAGSSPFNFLEKFQPLPEFLQENF